MKKTIVCPNCRTRVTVDGLPGERVFVTCPRCNTPGFFTFPKTVEPKHLKQKKEEVEPSKILLTPRRLLAIGIAAVFTILLMFCVILPTIQGSMHFLIVLSGSMSPEINAGDIVISMRVNPEEIKVNDIITFRYKDEPENCITHRVVNVIDENGRLSFMTKGDANEDPDQRIVESSELIGKVAFVIPYLGYLPHFARTKIGFVTLVIIPGSLIIINEIWNIIKTLKKKEPDEVRK
ncbi:MAG: signal peptidase I [Candidatus Aenigmarchaeota archaeon]|nr:signal peptidase I [Candidatus Aenigmarchaeota archaeon]